MGPKSSVSMRDVAVLAKVSVGTVSNVLNSPDRVSESTRRRVEQAIEKLGWVPNESARQLRAGRSRSIGMVVMDIANPFFTDVVKGAEDLLYSGQYSVQVGNSDSNLDRELTLLERFEQQRVGGVLFAPIEESAEWVLRLRPARNWRADSFGTQPSFSMACSTRRLVVSETRSGEFNTLETVPTDTFASTATSRMLTELFGPMTLPVRRWSRLDHKTDSLNRLIRDRFVTFRGTVYRLPHQPQQGPAVDGSRSRPGGTRRIVPQVGNDEWAQPQTAPGRPWKTSARGVLPQIAAAAASPALSGRA